MYDMSGSKVLLLLNTKLPCFTVNNKFLVNNKHRHILTRNRKRILKQWVWISLLSFPALPSIISFLLVITSHIFTQNRKRILKRWVRSSCQYYVLIYFWQLNLHPLALFRIISLKAWNQYQGKSANILRLNLSCEHPKQICFSRSTDFWSNDVRTNSVFIELWTVI